MTQTFAQAEKRVLYQIGAELFERVKQADAMKRPDAIRALDGDRVCWFVPADFIAAPKPMKSAAIDEAVAEQCEAGKKPAA